MPLLCSLMVKPANHKPHKSQAFCLLAPGFSAWINGKEVQLPGNFSVKSDVSSTEKWTVSAHCMTSTVLVVSFH
jgi:hypothetical protein